MVMDFNKILNDDGIPRSDCIKNHYDNVYLFYDNDWTIFLPKLPEIHDDINKGLYIKFNLEVDDYEKFKSKNFMNEIFESRYYNTIIIIGIKSILFYSREAEISLIATKRNIDIEIKKEVIEVFKYNTSIINGYTNWFGRVANLFDQEY